MIEFSRIILYAILAFQAFYIFFRLNTKDYVFVVCKGNIYKCSESTGKVTKVLSETGIVYLQHESM